MEFAEKIKGIFGSEISVVGVCGRGGSEMMWISRFPRSYPWDELGW